MIARLFCVFVFFRAEDGIRGFHVTGVQTCALPISHSSNVGPLPEPPRTMTLGRPAVCSTRSALRPFSRAQAATCSAMRVSPAAPAISAGLTESIDTSAVSRSTTSSLMEILLSVWVGRPALGAQQHDYGLVADAE